MDLFTNRYVDILFEILINLILLNKLVVQVPVADSLSLSPILVQFHLLLYGEHTCVIKRIYMSVILRNISILYL